MKMSYDVRHHAPECQLKIIDIVWESRKVEVKKSNTFDHEAYDICTMRLDLLAESDTAWSIRATIEVGDDLDAVKYLGPKPFEKVVRDAYRQLSKGAPERELDECWSCRRHFVTKRTYEQRTKSGCCCPECENRRMNGW